MRELLVHAATIAKCQLRAGVTILDSDKGGNVLTYVRYRTRQVHVAQKITVGITSVLIKILGVNQSKYIVKYSEGGGNNVLLIAAKTFCVDSR